MNSQHSNNQRALEHMSFFAQSQLPTLEGWRPINTKYGAPQQRELTSPYIHQPNLLTEFPFWWQSLFPKKTTYKSKNSIWDTVKLLERFKKSDYLSLEAKIELLTADAIHHAKEMALVEPITRFSYWHTIATNETLGDGYVEDMVIMLNTFAQDLAEKGLASSRASIETITFEKARQALSKIAVETVKTQLQKEKQNKISPNNTFCGTGTEGILITSFPDSVAAGYHGVDSKDDWDKSETHHSFFYLLKVGAIETDNSGNVIRFTIETTQYRAWPNARQALALHELLNNPITQYDDKPIPNLLFANLIYLNKNQLEAIAQQFEKSTLSLLTSPALADPQENELEKFFKLILYKDSEQQLVNFTQIPELDVEKFWLVQKQYFTDFYLSIATPIFEEIYTLQATPNPDKKTRKLIQSKIDYLDKAFFYYSKVLFGWVKLNNTNPKYTDAFKERDLFRKLFEFQQKILLRFFGQKQSEQLPSISELKTALNTDHKLATGQKVSNEEKKQLLSIWGFFSFVGSFGSLLQCGAIAPFTLPISIMNKSFSISSSLTEFSSSVASISIQDKQKLLASLKHEEYVELDLTKQQPVPAKKIYTVPKSYLEGDGCIVDETGAVLGPCYETKIINGVAVKKRIPLDDPRDTLAFPMTLDEFNQYIQTLQKNIEQSSLDKIDAIFSESHFSETEKRTAQTAIKRLRQILIKQSLTLQDFVTGTITNETCGSNNAWLQELFIRLSFSLNPVETLVIEVEKKLTENSSLVTDAIENIN